MSCPQKNFFIVLGSKTQSSTTKAVKNPYQKGIILERQLRISYDKLYDPYDLHDLSQRINGQRGTSNDFDQRLRDTELEAIELGFSKQMACEICQDNHPIPFFAECNHIQKDANNLEDDRKQSSQKESDLPIIPETISSEHTIYYTCLSQEIERNMWETNENENLHSTQANKK